MIRLTNIDGRVIYFAPVAIVQITEAGVSQAWHGIRANVKTFDGKCFEVRETPDAIAQLMAEREPAQGGK